MYQNGASFNILANPLIMLDKAILCEYTDIVKIEYVHMRFCL